MSAAAWGAYWAGARASACLPGAPPEVEAWLAEGWRRFAAALPRGARLLDLATGAGAVLAVIGRARRDLELMGVDSAPLPAGRPGLRGGIDCADLPFSDGAFDAVTSQFGVEYADARALAEAARVLAPGGRLRFVVHHAASRAVAHNRARHDAIAAMIEAGLFRLARQAVVRAEDPALARAVAAARARHAAQSVTAELPAALAQALARPAPLPAIAALETKAGHERARLAAMQAAARDEAGIAALGEALGRAGLAEVSVRAGPAAAPIAWVVTAGRPA
ncbi:MAG: methyltransferase domain-containing protein [Sphingomonadaceae bacterium]